MSQDILGEMGERAKSHLASVQARESRGAPVKSRGALIMEIAETIRPDLMKALEGERDKNGFLLQPAYIRALAIDVAQRIVRREDEKV